jgi:phosphoglycolate phosphatase
MVRVDALIFDLDGTLADTLEDIASATNHVLEAMGLPRQPLDRFPGWVGEGARRLVEQALAAAGDPEQRVDDALERFRARYGANLMVKTVLYAGVPEMLDALTLRHVPLGVLSNKPHDMTRRIVDTLCARWHFEAVFGHQPSANRKPDPVTALEIATALGVEPSRCAFVGDTAVDMDTAVAAGMVPLGVGWGFHPVATLTEHGAVTVLHEPSELLAWIDELHG